MVIDPFGGSGSTLMACAQTDRICRTMELDPRYASVIVLRYKTEYPDDNNHRLEDFWFIAVKAANREPCTPPRFTLFFAPAVEFTQNWG